MARPKKQTVDYFPHYVKCGRTIYILENKFGNDGYAFWFKLLEVLTNSNGHYYDCSNTFNWEFLLAKTRCNADTANKVIKTLIDLGKVDAHLWEQRRMIWVQNLVDHFTEIYRKRSATVPEKPSFCDENPSTSTISDNENPSTTGVSATETPQSKVKQSKDKYPYQDICTLWNSICVSLPKVQKLNDNRRTKIKCRCDEWGKNRETWLQTAETLFKRVQASDFLTGRTQTKTGWVASFDWFFKNPSNWVKVQEGNYDNKGAEKRQNSVRLGAGERIENGRRTYGTGAATIPMSAPPRPSDSYCWNEENQTWIML